eukprot:m.104386 g.104386  ORF g.104386 m.104386 type:complete len:136 (-) comp13259_c0_seq4:1530-1937(-)
MQYSTCSPKHLDTKVHEPRRVLVFINILFEIYRACVCAWYQAETSNSFSKCRGLYMTCVYRPLSTNSRFMDPRECMSFTFAQEFRAGANNFWLQNDVEPINFVTGSFVKCLCQLCSWYQRIPIKGMNGPLQPVVR